MDDNVRWLLKEQVNETPILFKSGLTQISGTTKVIFLKWLTSRLQGAAVEALDRMDPDLIEAPRDSPTLQQAPAPGAQIIMLIVLISFLC